MPVRCGEGTILCKGKVSVALNSNWAARSVKVRLKALLALPIHNMQAATLEYDAYNGYWIVGTSTGLVVVDSGVMRNPTVLGESALIREARIYNYHRLVCLYDDTV